MVKTRQRKINIFEIDNSNEKKCIEFLRKNAPLLQNYPVIFAQEPGRELCQACVDLGLTYFVSNRMDFLNSQKSHQSELKPSSIPLRVISRTIRSGEEIRSEGSLIICLNVHHGARIDARGDLIIFGRCEGQIECGGEYLILKSIYSSQIIFSGQIFSPAMIEQINQNPDCLKLITCDGESVKIKEIR